LSKLSPLSFGEGFGVRKNKKIKKRLITLPNLTPLSKGEGLG